MRDRSYLDQAKRALSKIRYFRDLPETIQEALAEAARRRDYEAGQVIYVEGEPADAIYILEKGWVKAVRISPDGREQAMLVLREGEIFGDIAVLAGTSYPGTVIALEPVRVWKIESSVVLQLLEHYPELAMAVIRHLAARVMYYVGLVEDLSLRSVEMRLAHTLLRHAEREGEELYVPRRAWATYDEIAVRLGTVRDVLGRALNALEKEGLIHVERDRIRILDPEGLAQRGNS